MDRVFKIGVFGLAPNEQNTLGSIFKLAASRNRKYVLVGPNERASAEIVIVDADDPRAVEAYKSFNVHHGKVPMVRVTKGVAAPSETMVIRRPMTLKRVLETLDRVTIDVLKFVPELVVGGDDGSLDEAAAAALKDAASSAQQVARSGVKALVVDDSAAVRKSMEIQLGLFGIQIDFAETGEEALQITQNTTDFDIIFLDIMMPGIDGYQVCKKFRSDKSLKHKPIIMLTGKGSRFDKLKGTMAGASLYLTKPVDQGQLQEVLKKFLPQLGGGAA
jgi:twitching motility two-component system response regulator PilG